MPHKEITREHEAHLTRVDIDPGKLTGRVLGEQEEPPARSTDTPGLAPFRQAFAQALPAAAASGLVPQEVIDEARQSLATASPHKFTHPVQGPQWPW
ncbi:hypothetical protein BJF82_10150 [Kytococcus sp. CUA-901]|nr:hypothetical protein BJF82_10150 [Kytococcus sp. CUA-901]